MKYKVGYIGNYYKIPEYIIQNESYELMFVVCEDNKMSNEMLTFLLVRGIEFKVINNKEELVCTLNGLDVDFWIMCSFGIRVPVDRIISGEIYNIHLAELPYYKGRQPTFWATVCGEKKLGITLHLVTEELDQGEIISQVLIPYYIWMYEEDAFLELIKQVPKLLEGLVEYKMKKRKGKPNRQGDYFRTVKEEDIIISLKEDCATIYNKVRSQSRYRGAKLFYKDEVYWVKKVEFGYKTSISEDMFVIPYQDDIFLVIIDYEKETI